MRLNHPELVYEHPAHLVQHSRTTPNSSRKAFMVGAEKAGDHIITEIVRCVEFCHMSSFCHPIVLPKSLLLCTVGLVLTSLSHS
jgi:hypothetical protein